MLVFIGDRGLCPVCGAEVSIVGSLDDGLLLGSCGDGFPLKRWAKEVIRIGNDNGYPIHIVYNDDNRPVRYPTKEDYETLPMGDDLTIDEARAGLVE